MKLSILLITYNHLPYIKQCLEGILIQQTSFDFEIVVADDCSTDDTVAIIKDVFNGHKMRCHLLKSDQNLGLEKNYKRGFEACNGEYIAVIEGDDYWTDPRRLQKHVDFLDQHHECSMSFNRLIVYLEEQADYSIKEWPFPDNYAYLTSRKLASGNQLGNLSACVFRSKAYKKLKPGIFDLKVADWMLAMAFGQFGLIGLLKDPMSVYRIHKNGLWSNQNKIEQIRIIINSIDQYNHYLDNNYKSEFNKLKKRLKKEVYFLKGGKNYKAIIVSCIPRFIIIIIKLLLPDVVAQKLKRLVY